MSYKEVTLYQDAQEVWHPEYHEEEEIILPEQKPKEESKHEFYYACISIANVWLGCLAFWIPIISYCSSVGKLNVGGLFWMQIGLAWTVFNVWFINKNLKQKLKK